MSVIGRSAIVRTWSAAFTLLSGLGLIVFSRLDWLSVQVSSPTPAGAVVPELVWRTTVSGLGRVTGSIEARGGTPAFQETVPAPRHVQAADLPGELLSASPGDWPPGVWTLALGTVAVLAGVPALSRVGRVPSAAVSAAAGTAALVLSAVFACDPYEAFGGDVDTLPDGVSVGGGHGLTLAVCASVVAFAAGLASLANVAAPKMFSRHSNHAKA